MYDMSSVQFCMFAMSTMRDNSTAAGMLSFNSCTATETLGCMYRGTLETVKHMVTSGIFKIFCTGCTRIVQHSAMTPNLKVFEFLISVFIRTLRRFGKCNGVPPSNQFDYQKDICVCPYPEQTLPMCVRYTLCVRYTVCVRYKLCVRYSVGVGV